MRNCEERETTLHAKQYELLLENVLTLQSQSEDQQRDETLNQLGLTKLHAACILNEVEVVKDLLQRNDVNVNERVDEKSSGWDGMTPLFCYVVSRYLRKNNSPDLSIAMALLQRGADVMEIRCDGTVVHKAFELHCYKRDRRTEDREDLRLMELLLSYQRNFRDNPTIRTQPSHFHIACACNDCETVMKFLQDGVDVNQKVDYFCEQFGGCSPLHIATIYKSKETVDILLKNKADVNSTNSSFETPLHIAAKLRFENSYIIAFLRAGADVNAQNIQGATPVEELIQYKACTMEEMELCLKKGFKVNVFNPVTGIGFLGKAFNDRRNSELFYKIIVESTDLTRLDGRNRNAIHNVVSVKSPEEKLKRGTLFPMNDYTKAIEALMRLNLNVDQQDIQGKTPLHHATQMQNAIAIKGLLNNGADINLLDASGKTAYENCVDSDKEINFVEIENYYNVSDAFISHVYKLARQNLDVNEAIRNLQKKNVCREILAKTEKNCRKELETLRADLIGNGLSLHDFLSETGALINIPFNEREAVEEFFANEIRYLQTKYPELAGILILQFKNTLKRRKIIPSAFDSIDVLAQREIPYVCSKIILLCLSNGNLKNLIDAACL